MPFGLGFWGFIRKVDNPVQDHKQCLQKNPLLVLSTICMHEDMAMTQLVLTDNGLWLFSLAYSSLEAGGGKWKLDKLANK